jgi:hypothetical protein
MRRRRGAIGGGGAMAGSQMSSLYPRRSSISSRCPAVVISPVTAPLISIMVLSAVVVPWTTALVRASRSVTSSPSPAASTAMPLSTPSD